jgi:hypothetical protein
MVTAPAHRLTPLLKPERNVTMSVLEPVSSPSQAVGSASRPIGSTDVVPIPQLTPTVLGRPTVSAVTTGAPSRVVGKTRNPWGVWLLGLTIVYPFIWYFKINKELRDFSHEIDVQPGLALLAFCTPFVNLVSWTHTTSRIQKAQKMSGSRARCSVLLSFVCVGFWTVYVQSQMNKVWDQFGNPPTGTAIV